MPSGNPQAPGAVVAGPASRGRRDPLAGRVGLSVPHEWWASAPLLKSYEAAGFAWVQLHSPPPSVLRDSSQCRRHAAAAGTALATTGLGAVVHAPGVLRAGTAEADRALEGLLSYAAELGASQIVYHALAVPDAPQSEDALRAEAESLGALASLAERLELIIAIENLCPTFPGPESVSASPLSLRGLAQRVDSEHVKLCVDLGHAHVIADLRHTSLELLIEPVLDLVSAFHLHDNLGARWGPGPLRDEQGIDPLRLDLHLPPGRGSLPWESVAPLLAEHEAPLLLEVHPPFRPKASELFESFVQLLDREPPG
jgi:sugar phosphate isomerase/epimerase